MARKKKGKRFSPRARMFKIVKAVALEAPLFYYMYDGWKTGATLGDKVINALARMCHGTTGVKINSPTSVTFDAGGLIYGWGGPAVYTGLKFAGKMIPGGSEMNPFKQLSNLTGG